MRVPFLTCDPVGGPRPFHRTHHGDQPSRAAHDPRSGRKSPTGAGVSFPLSGTNGN